MVRLFAERVLSNDRRLQPHVESFHRICIVLDLFKMAKVAPNGLRQILRKFGPSYESFLESYVELYGICAVLPKHHMTQHLRGQLERDGFLLDCWTLERFYKLFKGISRNIVNTKRFEWSTAIRAFAWQKEALQNGNMFRSCLLPPVCNEGNEGKSKSIKWHAMTISEGDVIFSGMDDAVCFKVLGCFSAGCRLGLCLQRLTPCSSDKVTCSWKVEGPEQRMLLADELRERAILRHASFWYYDDDLIVVVR